MSGTIDYNYQATIQAYDFERTLHEISELEKKLRFAVVTSKRNTIKDKIKWLLLQAEQAFETYETLSNKDVREDNSEGERRERLDQLRGKLKNVKERWEGK